MMPATFNTVPAFSVAQCDTTVTPTGQSFGYPNSTVTSPNSTIPVTNNVVWLNPGVAAGKQNATITLHDEGNSSNFTYSYGNNVTQTTVSHIIGSPLPASTLVPPNIGVLPQNTLVPGHLEYSVATSSAPQRFIMVPASLAHQVLTTSSPSTSGPNQPQNHISTAAVNNKGPVLRLVKVATSSGGSITSLKAYSAPPNNSGATQMSSTRPLKNYPKSFPKPLLIKDIMLPTVQPDGSMRLEKRRVCCTKEMAGRSTQSTASHLTLKEVSNNLEESGVAKKFVVCGADNPRPPVSNNIGRKIIGLSCSQAGDRQLVSKMWVSPGPVQFRKTLTNKMQGGPPYSSLPTKQPEPGPDQNTSNSNQIGFQWHQPYTGDPPSIEDSTNEYDTVCISDDDDEQTPVVMTSQLPSVCISDDDDEEAALVMKSQQPLVSEVNEIQDEPADKPPVLGTTISITEVAVDISGDDKPPILETKPYITEVAVKIPDDEPPVPGTPTPVAGVAIKIPDDDPEVPGMPNPVSGVAAIENHLLCTSDDDDKLNLIKFSQVHDGSIFKYPAPDAQEIDDPLKCPNSGKRPFKQHQRRSDFGSLSANDKSRKSQKSGTKTQSKKPKLQVKIKYGNWKTKFTTESMWPHSLPSKSKKSKRDKILAKKKKKKKEKEKACMHKKASVLALPKSQVDGPSSMPGTVAATDSKTEVTRCGPPASPSPLPVGFGGSVSDSGQSSIKCHQPCGSPGKSDDSARKSIKIEPISTADVGSELAQVSQANELGGSEVIPEVKYFSHSSPEELSPENEQNIPRVDPNSVQSVEPTTASVPITTPPSEENPKSSCNIKDAAPSMVYDEDLEEICSVESASPKTATPTRKSPKKERADAILNSMALNLKKKLNAKAGIVNTNSTSKPLKRVLVEGLADEPDKTRKKRKIHKTQSSTSSSTRKPHGGRKNTDVNPGTDVAGRKDSSWDKIVEPDVLRDCILRKTIQDCYSKGLIPTIDKIHSDCCESGLEFPKQSVAPYLISIGYKWFKFKSKRWPVEDHRLTSERIKYLKELEKYRRRNFVYIFVSDYVINSENGWQLSRSDVNGSGSRRVVLQAMSNKKLLESGLKVGLDGLMRCEIASWLETCVMPNIPKGSLIILGNHTVFDKDEESVERPGIGDSKESIISWLNQHKVTSANPNLPKAMLLSMADDVVLPKTSVYDGLIRKKGFFSVHLPKHHKDLNPIEFLWRDIMDKLRNTPEIKTNKDFEVFVTREFSACSQMASSVACNLVRRFEKSYREFDERFDELLDKVMSAADADASAAPAVASAAPAVVNAAPTVSSAAAVVAPQETPAPQKTACPVCRRLTIMKGFRCLACQAFWKNLCSVFRKSKCSTAKLPVCNDKNHAVTRPPECRGCRRYMYEQVLLRQPFILKKLPKYSLPILPVTKEGKPYSPKVVRLTKNSKHSTPSSSLIKVKTKKSRPKH